MQSETSGIVILEPEQEKESQQELEVKQKQETKLTSKATETGNSIAWLIGIDGLKNEISSLSEESEKLKSKLELFKPQRERLGLALKAAELDGDYATLTAVRNQQDTNQKALRIEEGKLPDLESSTGQKKEALEKTEQLTIKAKEELKTAVPLIRKVRSLDQQLADKKNAIDNSDADCRKDTEQIQADKKLKTQEQENRDTSQNELKLVQKYMKTNSRDEWLVSGLAGIEEQLGNILSAQKDIFSKKAVEREAGSILNAATKKLVDCTTQLNTRKKELEDVQKGLELKKKDLALFLGDRLLREHRTEKETLLREMAFLRKIASLETERSKLEDGKPCPLCGAEEHPFAEGNIPETDEAEKKIENLTELIQKAEELESGIKKLESEEKDALKNLTDSEKLESDAANDKKNAGKSLTNLTEDLKEIALRFTDLKKSTLNKLQPLGIEDIPDSDVPSLLTSLKERLKGWQDQLKKKADIEKQLSELESELKRLDAVIETRSKTLVDKQTTFGIIKKEFKIASAERQELFGAKSPDAEETLLGKTVTEAEIVEKHARTTHDEVKQQFNSAKVNIVSLKEQIEKRFSELKQLETEFEGSRQSAGFVDERQFLDAILLTADRDELKAKVKELDDWQTDMMARQKDRGNRLTTEIAKKVTESKLEDLEPVHKELEENLKQLRDDVAGLRHKLTENTANEERIIGKQSAITAQKQECHRWEKLHGLIGSADGKKYRNFAQGLTFELMVSHANRQLEKMTDRYLLIRDDEQPLELNVIDNYQAGEIRSTKNLSGGESFIVSLTLALGLSKMASRKVRVDSLFLDEGFGTLDEESLETSLEALAGLQQDGKLIGIISHVSALKERISTQLNLHPTSGGRSKLTGPGCSEIISKVAN